MKRLAWVVLGIVVLLIVVFDNPWPRSGSRGPLPGPAGGVEIEATTAVLPSHTQLVLPSTPIGTR